jgi:hypothetical protein
VRQPPRPIAPGDIVVGHSEHVGEWTAAQITEVDPDQQLVAVLDLDWSGPEPTGLDDLGELTPLRPTHHNGTGDVVHCWHVWTVPRGHRVLGSRPLLHDESPSYYGSLWTTGLQLALQRRWDAGGRQGTVDTGWYALHTTATLPATPQPQVRALKVHSLDTLDCAPLPTLFPNLTSLSLYGKLGTLTNSTALRELTGLRHLTLGDVFGMSAADAVLPVHLPDLAWLELGSVPADYAAAMRTTWAPEAANGTHTTIRQPRKPAWVAENRDNPLRDWDGREHIPGGAVKKAFAQYRTTRRAVLAALGDPAGAEQLVRLGEEYGEAFNAIDRRWQFIETIEREELIDALARIPDQDDRAREALERGVEATRDW